MLNPLFVRPGLALLLLFTLAPILAWAQITTATINAPVQMDAYPPSPNASALGMFADVPVGLYTGTPQVGVPLWQVREGDISVPVSLSYHSGGVLSSTISSSVGLNWALNAGGVITRTVRGLPDDLPQGYLDPSYPFPQPTPRANQYYSSQFATYAFGTNDSQPDLFCLNFAGRSAKFIIGQDWKCYLAPFQKIKIAPVRNGTGGIPSFTITTEDGYVYTFDVLEKNKTQNVCPTWGQTSTQVPDYTTAWYLSKITSPTQHAVRFEYQLTPQYDYISGLFGHRFNPLNVGGSLPRLPLDCQTRTIITQGVKPSRIVFTNGSVEFAYAPQDRYDLPGDKQLDAVLVKNSQGRTVRKFRLGYRYMQAGSSDLLDVPPYGYTVNDATRYRLMLVSVQENDSIGKLSKPAYEFYYTPGLPDRLTCAVDHWGFYNGQTYNNTLVPRDMYNGMVLEGAVRDVYLEHTVKGSLSKIVYPTGSVATFTYELHEADQGQPKFSTRTADLYSDNLSGRPLKAMKKVNFTVSSSTDGAWVDMRFTPACTIDSAKPCAFDMGIAVAGNDSSVFNTRTLTKTTAQVYLRNGSYYLFGVANGYYSVDDTLSYHPYEMHISWNETISSQNYDIGGLRVKRVETYDPVSGKTSVKAYTYNDATGKTSGHVLGLPVYGYLYEDNNVEVTYGIEGNKTTMMFLNKYYARSSASVVPMGLTQGSYVGYGEVTVWHGEWDAPYAGKQTGYNGKSVYKYTHPGLYPDKGVTMSYPFSPGESREWMRGLLLEAADYKRVTNISYVPVKKVVNEYTFYDETNPNGNVSNCLGLKVAFTRMSQDNALTGDYEYRYYNYYTGYVELAKSTETVYEQNDAGKTTTKETRYTYSPVHLQPVNIEETRDGNYREGNYICYPLDYADASDFVTDLKNAGIIDVPVEKVSYTIDSTGNVSITGGSINTFLRGSAGLKEASYMMETDLSVLLASFRFSGRSTKGIVPTTGTPVAFQLDTSLYKKQSGYEVYDSKGNLLQSTSGGVTSSVVMGYNNTIAVARAAYASADQIAYTGFEPGENATAGVQSQNVVSAATEPGNVYAGASAYRLDKVTAGNTFYGPVLKVTPLTAPQGQYRLSCRIKTPAGYTAGKAYINLFTYQKGQCCAPYPAVSANSAVLYLPATNGQWQYFETVLDMDKLNAGTTLLTIQSQIANTDTNVPVYIDEISVSPADAVLTTATCEPLTGITSQSSGEATVYYVYDSLGRLQYTLDREGNMVETASYTYSK